MTLFINDKARQNAINEIEDVIEILRSVPHESLGSVETKRICGSLAHLQDMIYDEAENKKEVERYRGE